MPGVWTDVTRDGINLPRHGHATCRLTVLMKKSDAALAFKFLTISTAFSFYANGERIYGAGRTGDTRESSVPGYRPGIADYVAGAERLDLVLHVSNFHYRTGGPWYDIYLGHETGIREQQSRALNSIIFLFGSFFIMGLYHVFFYALRRKELSALYFSVFCFLIALRTISTGEYFLATLVPSLPFELLIKAEYFSFFMSVMFFSLFVRSLFPGEFHLRVLQVLTAAGVSFALLVAVTPSRIYTFTVQAYEIITLLAALYVLYVLVMASVRGRQGARVFLGGFFLLFFAVVNDVLNANFILRTGYIIDIGFFAFIFCQSFVLSMRFARTFTSVEKLSENLKRTNLALNRFVPEQFLKLLDRASIVDVVLGDQVQREMTILFSDIRNFTRLSEAMSPVENFNFINSYLKRMEPVIEKHGGFIDKYIGDAIMALFPDRPASAVMATREMMTVLLEYNRNRASVGYQPIAIGIGIHSGFAMLGTVGGANRMDGTVISDAVNLAARLEGLTKTFGAQAVISEKTLGETVPVEGLVTRFLGKIKVKGKDEAVGVHEIIAPDFDGPSRLKAETLAEFNGAIRAFLDRDYAAAARGFNEVITRNPDDRAAAVYLKKIASREEELGAEGEE